MGGDSVHAMTDDGSGSDVFSSVANSEVRDVDGFPEEVPSEASEIKDSECSRYDSGTNALLPFATNASQSTPAAGASARSPRADTERQISAHDHGADSQSISPSLKDIIKFDIFGNSALSDSAVLVSPLVEVWFELEEYLTADTISSPAELFREANAVEM